MTEWNVVALVAEKWGLPGVILLGLCFVVYRFGLRPHSEPAMTTETADAIAALTRKIDAQHVEAQGARDEVSKALHNLDNRMVRIEVTLEHIKR